MKKCNFSIGGTNPLDRQEEYKSNSIIERSQCVNSSRPAVADGSARELPSLRVYLPKFLFYFPTPPSVTCLPHTSLCVCSTVCECVPWAWAWHNRHTRASAFAPTRPSSSVRPRRPPRPLSDTRPASTTPASPTSASTTLPSTTTPAMLLSP